MSFTIITGGAGTGKTTRLFQKIITSARIAPERTHIVLVPEQATLQTEGRLVAMHPDHILFNIEVLSFNRLAYRLYDHENTGVPVFLDESGKSMLIRKAAENRKNGFEIYRNGLHRTGVINHMKAAVSELMQYGIRPERLQELSAALPDDPLLAGKLRDLSALYTEYLKIKDTDTLSAEELQGHAAALLERSDYLRGAMIAIDGFTGFTPVQLSIIGQLMRRAIDCTVAVTVPAGASTNDVDEFDLHALTKKTVRKLIDTASANNIKANFDPVPETGVKKQPADLAFASAHFPAEEKKPEPFAGRAAHIFVADCGSPDDEAVFVADTISRLVREKGYRYRDFAVVSADLEGNRTYLARAFERAGIPAYIDVKKGIMEQPIAVFLLSAVEAAEKNWPYDAVLRCLRTGLADVTPDEVDLLDNYAAGAGISGRKKWTEPFTRTYKNHRNIDLDRLNEIRSRAVRALDAFHTALKPRKRSCSTACEALRALLHDLQIEQKLAAMAERYEAEGALLESRLYAQIYPYVEKLIDQAEHVLGLTVCSLKELKEILQAGLSQLAIGSVPPVLDEVQTGDLRRSRRGRTKVLFLINCIDKNLPQRVFEAGVFTDEQREKLAKLDLELAPTARENSIHERFYMHELVTQPEDLLYVTYSRRDRLGNSVAPSTYIPQLTGLFEGLQPVRFEADRVRLPESLNEARRLFAASLRERRTQEDAGRLRQLYAAFSGIPAERDFLRNVMDAGFYVKPEKRLRAQTLARLYPGDVTTSATALEKQAACPYSAFLRGAMRLKEREVFELDLRDVGTIDHGLLEAAMRLIKEEQIDFADVDAAVCSAVTEEAFRRTYERYRDHIEGSFRDKYYIERFRKVTEKNLKITAGVLARSGFRPQEMELTFDGRQLQDLSLPLSNGHMLNLGGRIDRIDRNETEGGPIVRVVDYKTGNIKPDLSKVINGLSLQLMVYLAAARALSAPEALVGGAYYHTVQDPRIKAKDNRDDAAMIRAEKEKKLQLTGLQLDDPRVTAADPDTGGTLLSASQMEALTERVRQEIIRLGDGLTAGNIGIRPYRYKAETPCAWCEFYSVCGFDTKLAGCTWRRIPEQKLDDLTEDGKDLDSDKVDN